MFLGSSFGGFCIILVRQTDGTENYLLGKGINEIFGRINKSSIGMSGLKILVVRGETCPRGNRFWLNSFYPICTVHLFYQQPTQEGVHLLRGPLMADCCSTHDSLFLQYSHPNFLTLSHVVLSQLWHALLLLQYYSSLFVLLCHTVSPYYLHMKGVVGNVTIHLLYLPICPS